MPTEEITLKNEPCCLPQGGLKINNNIKREF